MSVKYISLEVNAVNEEMELSDLHLGEKPDIELKKIQVRIAENPDLINYYEMLLKSGAKISEEVNQLAERADLFLVTHSVGIIDNNNHSRVVQLGFKLQAESPELLQNQCLLPDTAFVKPKISGGIHLDAGFNVNGDVVLPKIGTEIFQIPLKASLAGDAKASIGGNLSLNFSLPLLAPSIQTVGKYSNYAEWSVNADQNKYLAGDQVFIQFIAVPKGTTMINLKAQVYVSVRSFGVLTSRRESKWVQLKELASNKSTIPSKDIV